MNACKPIFKLLLLLLSDREMNLSIFILSQWRGFRPLYVELSSRFRFLQRIEDQNHSSPVSEHALACTLTH